MRKYLFSLFFLLLPGLCFGLSVDAPTAGELIPAGTVYTSIQWTPAAGSTKFNIYASYDNGMTWSTPLNTTGKVTGTTFDWTVPAMTKNRTKCKVKVVGYNDAGTKIEAGISQAFTINVLNVTYPNAVTDVLDAGHIRTITWDTATLAPATSAKLSYTLDGGLTWLPIATIAGNPGFYDWTVPQLSSDDYANVRVDLWNGAVRVAFDVSGAFSIDVSPKTNADASGTYSMPYMDYDYYTLPGVVNTHIFDLTVNGAGLFNHATFASSQNPPPSSATNVPYSVSPDGQIIAGNARGIVSDDDNMILLAELGKGKLLGSGLAIKMSSGLSNAILDGTYLIGQIGVNLAFPDDWSSSWAARFTATFYGDGNANIHCDAMTGVGGCVFTDLAITYTVDAQGRVSDSLGQQGMVTADGNVFTLVDFTAADNSISRMVGMKKASGGLSDATMAGKFIAATFGISDTHGPWTDVFQVKLNGKGGGSATELYTSWPPLTPTHPAEYSVSSDGSLGLGPTGAEVQGIVMENGQGFLVMDTASLDERSITIGLKKAK